MRESTTPKVPRSGIRRAPIAMWLIRVTVAEAGALSTSKFRFENPKARFRICELQRGRGACYMPTDAGAVGAFFAPTSVFSAAM
jgi:hypothetical protein